MSPQSHFFCNRDYTLPSPSPQGSRAFVHLFYRCMITIINGLVVVVVEF